MPCRTVQFERSPVGKMVNIFRYASQISMNQQSEARKAEKFWSEMRSTCYLFSKSSWPSEDQAARLVSELRDILGKRIIIYPPVLAEFGIGADTPYRLKKTFLGLDQVYNNAKTIEEDKRFFKFMAQGAGKAVKLNWQWRIAEEAEQKQIKGWYPFFVTLTVDPKKCNGEKYDSPEQLWKEGREFRKYIRRLVNVVCGCLGHPPAHKKTKEYGYRPESDYVQYAGVIEHGASREHHHGHFMIWMKEIPSHWKKDPNEGRLPEYRFERENKAMRFAWPWAIDSQKPALYYRTKGDIWSQLGHVTPIDRETRKPIKIRDVRAVGAYVMKYMQKDKRIWHHRMKCTRNLGMNRLQKILMNQSQKTLEALSWKPNNSKQHHLVSLTHSVPIGLVTSQAKRMLFWDRYRKKQLVLKQLMKTNYGHFKRMLKSVRDGARPDRMHSAQLYDWVIQHLPDQKVYCKDRILEAHKLLSAEFPRIRHKVEPVVIGANEIGYTYSV